MKREAELILQTTLREWVYFDLRHWPASQSLQHKVKTDLFSPNTLSHLRTRLDSDHYAQHLIAKAETDDWSEMVATELFAHLELWLIENVNANQIRSGS